MILVETAVQLEQAGVAWTSHRREGKGSAKDGLRVVEKVFERLERL